MENRAYWIRRAKQEKKRVDREIEIIAAEITKSYKHAMKNIDRMLAKWYQDYAIENEVSFQAAKMALNKSELADFKMTLEEYIKHGEELNVDESWLKAMKTASEKHHIDRFTALSYETRAELQEALAKWGSSATVRLETILTEQYLKTSYGIQKDIGLARLINGADLEKLKIASNKAWSPDGIEFVKRKGINNTKLVQAMQKEITQACITGEPYQKLAENITAQVGITVNQSIRIVRTEATHLATLAERQCYIDHGVSMYQYLATLDVRACDICSAMDGFTNKVSNMQEGVNAPPMHPNCRCTTIPYYDTDTLKESRIARDESGKSIYVPGNMTYEQWKTKYVK